MDQVSIKYTNIFHYKTPQNLSKLGFLVRKQTIWQPCFSLLLHLMIGWSLVVRYWEFMTWRTLKHFQASDYLMGRVARRFIFKPKIPILGTFWRALYWKMLIWFYGRWNVLRTFGISYDHLVHFVFICYVSSRFWYHVPRKIWQSC
jgi:hypothetical protein